VFVLLRLDGAFRGLVRSSLDGYHGHLLLNFSSFGSTFFAILAPVLEVGGGK
jgi:hypothetical protein